MEQFQLRPILSQNTSHQNVGHWWNYKGIGFNINHIEFTDFINGLIGKEQINQQMDDLIACTVTDFSKIEEVCRYLFLYFDPVQYCKLERIDTYAYNFSYSTKELIKQQAIVLGLLCVKKEYETLLLIMMLTTNLRHLDFAYLIEKIIKLNELNIKIQLNKTNWRKHHVLLKIDENGISDQNPMGGVSVIPCIMQTQLLDRCELVLNWNIHENDPRWQQWEEPVVIFQLRQSDLITYRDLIIRQNPKINEFLHTLDNPEGEEMLHCMIKTYQKNNLQQEQQLNTFVFKLKQEPEGIHEAPTQHTIPLSVIDLQDDFGITFNEIRLETQLEIYEVDISFMHKTSMASKQVLDLQNSIIQNHDNCTYNIGELVLSLLNRHPINETPYIIQELQKRLNWIVKGIISTVLKHGLDLDVMEATKVANASFDYCNSMKFIVDLLQNDLENYNHHIKIITKQEESAKPLLDDGACALQWSDPGMNNFSHFGHIQLSLDVMKEQPDVNYICQKVHNEVFFFTFFQSQELVRIHDILYSQNPNDPLIYTINQIIKAKRR